MNQSEEIRDLFGRYAAAVGRYLPAKGRDDIMREIETTLADRLDDRTPPGQTPTIEDAVALLKETGHYRKTAASYVTHGYVIGPSLYPQFIMVTRLVLSVLAAVLIGALTLSAALNPAPDAGIAVTALRILGSTAGGVLQSFALLVIIFAILERVDAGRAAAGLDAAWDPRQLPKIRAADVIRIPDQVAAIVMNTAYIVFLAFLPRIIAQASETMRGVMGSLALTPRLLELLPFFMSVAGIQILAAIFLLSRPSSTAAAVGAQVVVKALNIIGAGLFLSAWPFLVTGEGTLEGVALGFRILREIMRVGCYLGIVFGSIDVAATLLRYRRSAIASKS